MGNKTTELHGGYGPIPTIKWKENLIAWANDKVRQKPATIDKVGEESLHDSRGYIVTRWGGGEGGGGELYSGGYGA